uniref:Uncharacterized protein n=1 Tax=viral metagenome TaxID=1070528 RepID=A0A6M3J2T5_9ZZZZ
MSVTCATLRQYTSEELNDWNNFTTTEAGSSGATTIISTSLLEYDNSYFDNHWALVTSGTYIGSKRKIERHDNNYGLLDCYRAFGGQIATSVTFEVHKYDPDTILDKINVALREIFPKLRVNIIDDTIMGGNYVPNAHFEDCASSSYPDFWRNSGAGSSVAENTTYIRGGKKSAALTRVNNNCYLYISAAEYPQLFNLQGQTIRIFARVLASSASQARIELYSKQSDGTEDTTQVSDYHTGGGLFETLELSSGAVLSDAVDVSIRLTNNTTNGTVYWDDVWVVTDSREYFVPTSFEKVNKVFLLDAAYDDLNFIGETELYQWHQSIDSQGRLKIVSDESWTNRVRLYGMGKLSTLSDDTDTTELNDTQARLIAVNAALGVLENTKMASSVYEANAIERDISRMTLKKMQLERKIGQGNPAGVITMRKRYW